METTRQRILEVLIKDTSLSSEDITWAIENIPSENKEVDFSSLFANIKYDHSASELYKALGFNDKKDGLKTILNFFNEESYTEEGGITISQVVERKLKGKVPPNVIVACMGIICEQVFEYYVQQKAKEAHPLYQLIKELEERMEQRKKDSEQGGE